MKKFLVRSSTVAFTALVLALSGCGGGGGGVAVTPGDGGGGGGGGGTPESVAQALAQASTVASNDTSVNSTASFSVLQSAGMPAVTVNSPPKVNFAVFSDGQLKKDLKITNVSFAMAKLVPGAGGEPDQWVSYVYRKETATKDVGPGGLATPLATAMQATADPKQTDAALLAAQLVYNDAGYYTYTFSTDIKDATKTNGVTFEPNLTHRVVIQLSYTNAAGQTVRVNPYFDFTLDGNGNSVAVAPSAVRKMVDIATCNNCHDKLALHGGGRVDTQYCVVCHNNGTKDANSGNVLTLSTMVHKIHAGKVLFEEHGEKYTIWGNSNSKHDYSEVGFPQPIRNCAACHDGSNPKTPQGDNWKSVPSKEACLSCHQDVAGSAFFTKHVTELGLGASAAAIPNSMCATCHGASAPFSAEKVHWVQELANAANYEARIEGVTIKKAATSTAAGTMTVKVSVVNPKTGTAYDLREGCGYTLTSVKDPVTKVITSWTKVLTTKDQGGNTIPGCKADYRWDSYLPPNVKGEPTDKFGMFSVYLGTETLSTTVDDVTNTSSSAAYLGVDDGTHHYSVDVTIPAGARGNARVLLIGAVSERRIDPVSRAAVGAVPPMTNGDLAYVPVKNAVMDVNVANGTASTTPRRAIVSNDGCNKCHAILGLPMGPQTEGFHKGHRNNADTCAVCHNANQAGTYTLMADGSKGPVVGDSSTQVVDNVNSQFLHESYQAKRFVHGIHYGSKRAYPFTHCMTAGGVYNKDGTSATGGAAMSCTNSESGLPVNFTAEVAYPGQLKACSNCHVNDSWKQDKSTMGSVVFKPLGTIRIQDVAGTVDKPLEWLVMSPRVATCTTCHDSQAVKTHVLTTGGGALGYVIDSTNTANKVNQGDLLSGGKVIEFCDGCHLPGSAIGIDTVHMIK